MFPFNFNHMNLNVDMENAPALKSQISCLKSFT